MQKIFKRIKKDRNEKGSGIILVIVALSFLGIIAGALLTAVAYAYRLKLYDYNAKDNFHYVEQAMDEVYAGLGGRTTQKMQDAYTKTVEDMVYFDTVQRGYVNKSDVVANDEFKNNFMDSIKDDDAFKNIEKLSQLIQSYISNSSVIVENDKMRVIYYNTDGDAVLTVDKNGASSIDLTNIPIGKIVIQNLVLRRTASYKRSSASGTFTQTISTDIEISRPDFNVQFNTTSAKNSALYDYCLVADSGVEVNKNAAETLMINGNIYAGADFYNKDYNQYGKSDEEKKDYSKTTFIFSVKNNDGSVSSTSYRINPVTSKTYGDDKSFLFNGRLVDTLFGNHDGVFKLSEYSAGIDKRAELVYNGYNENSKYSGLYINGAKVSIKANTLVVPGTIAVMNGAELSVYGSNGTSIEKTNIWADNMVLGGYTAITPAGTKIGSKANLIANLFVRDDLEINCDNSRFSLTGSYYGYGNGTQTKRSFIPTVYSVDIDPAENVQNLVNVYQTKDKDDKYVDRSHYNSSAIVVNGENSTIDLSSVSTLFIAGQAYIELSAKHNDVVADKKLDDKGNVVSDDREIVYASGSNDKQAVEKEVLTYDPTVNDYRTGESLSVKSNQLIYIPNGSGQYDDVKDTIKINDYLLTPDGSGYNLFSYFFEDTSKVPCVSIVPAGSTRTYYYFDFGTIYENASSELKTKYKSAEEMAAAFATAYMAEFNKSSSSLESDFSPIKEYLDKDITSGDLFSAGAITMPNEMAIGKTPQVYASGALTEIINTNGKNTFNVEISKDKTVTNPVGEGDTSTNSGVLTISNNLTTHYNYVKFSLVDLAEDSSEALIVNNILNTSKYSEASISPINRYFDMQKVSEVVPNTGTDNQAEDGMLKLPSGYKVWLSNNDVEITSDYCETIDGQKVLRGIIVTKGDVYFAANVNRFEGLIVSGGKIYINDSVKSVSANPQVCKAIMTELQMASDPDAQRVLRAIIGYESAYDKYTLEQLIELCDSREIEYTDEQKQDEKKLIALLIAYDNHGDNKVKKIDTIDYSDVIRYSNWMKNSE